MQFNYIQTKLYLRRLKAKTIPHMKGSVESKGFSFMSFLIDLSPIKYPRIRDVSNCGM